MQINSRLTITIIIGIMLLCGGYLVWVLSKGILHEDLWFDRNSLEYQLYISSDFIESIPASACKRTYYFTGGDGPKSPAQGVSFRCGKPNDALLVAIENLLEHHAYKGDDSPLRNCLSLTTGTCTREYRNARSTVDIYVGQIQGEWECSVYQNVLY